ncbi:MAG: hypothetical protein ACW98X_22830 [Promethearchaeota archaeon]|jgi:hypothetical protein
MPSGMFLLIHDEIRGPEIKCSFYTNPVNLNKEFISKLYMSHAGFDSSSHIEIKFENYRSVSCFTGNLDRRSQKEGILGIIFEENEEFSNLDLFLQRNLYYIINNPNAETMQEIFSNKLLNYLELTQLFKKVEIEGIPELYLINGNSEYKYNILKIGVSSISIPEMSDFYEKIINNQIIPSYHYRKLNLEETNNTFLVLKSDESFKTIKMLISTLKYYLEKFYYYSLEILTLLLLPSVIKIIPLKTEISKYNSSKTKSFIQNLQKSNNYLEEFSNVITNAIKGNIYLGPSL